MAQNIQRAAPDRNGVDDPYRLAVLVRDSLGAPTAAAVVLISVQDVNTSKWWDNATGTWVVAFGSVAAIEVDDTNLIGLYERLIDVEGLGETDLRCQATYDGVTLSWVVQVRHTLTTQVVANGEVATPVATLADLLQLLKAVYSHDQILDDATKQCIIMQEDGVTPAISFDMQDATGAASAREVFKLLRS